MVQWYIGLSGSGKTTLSREVYRIVKEQIENCVLIDGDAIRQIFKNDLGHTIEDRKINADRICQLCKFLSDQNIHVICAILSIFEESRGWNRKNIDEYYEVFIDTPMELLEKIDYKGLYIMAKSGKIKDVAGIDLDFPVPKKPDKIIKNDKTCNHLLQHANRLAALLIESDNSK